MPDKVITINPANACCCPSAPAVTHSCRSKSGTAAGMTPDAPTDGTSGSCVEPREGDFSYEIDDCFGVLDSGSANYGAPNLPVIKMTVSFHVRFYAGPDSCDPVLSDDGFCLEGAFDTMIEITSLVIEFDDPDVSYTPDGEGIRPTSWGGGLAADGSPVNLGWCFSGEKVIEGVLNIPATYHDEILDIIYNLSGGTRTDTAWPTLCGLCLEGGGLNVLLATRLPAIVADTGIAWSGSDCTLSVTAPTGNPSTFDYTLVQVRANATGLVNGVDYEVTFIVQKYESSGPSGAGWYDYAEIIYAFTASGTTHTGTWVDLVTELAVTQAVQYRINAVSIAEA